MITFPIYFAEAWPAPPRLVIPFQSCGSVLTFAVLLMPDGQTKCVFGSNWLETARKHLAELYPGTLVILHRVTSFQNSTNEFFALGQGKQEQRSKNRLP